MQDQHVDGVSHQHQSSNNNNQEKRVPRWAQFIGFIFAYLGLSIGLTMVIIMIASVIDMLLGTESANQLSMTQYVSIIDAVAFVFALLIFSSIRLFIRDAFLWSYLKQWQTYLYLVITFALVYLSQYLIIDVWQLEQAGSQIDLFGLNQIDLGGLNLILLVIAFVIIAPILEEILFRAVIFGFLRVKFGLVIAIVVSSVIFGLLHPGHVLSASIMGMAISLLYVKSNTLLSAIIFHMIWNAFATYALLSFVI
ncbi:CPBP family intramembrane glutamic endopeptidase [Amphibacillus cookii]|uniref:CPBP family intramembrane glutamic endopeptidase n=1 Tax=Amphibacillus cookii TaxID=767787 RepID=UPI00195C075F|nr:CPBP family intramembrane glutamic endopeptidase [Amphibacillus cookii]MBM7540984.1 membrane protease YdiL (CAAX protease family) [Amphibacillus cookii]